MAPTERRQLNANLDAATHEALQTFCDDHGITTTALVEAFGRWILVLNFPHGRERQFAESVGLQSLRDSLASSAQKIDIERRRRSPE